MPRLITNPDGTPHIHQYVRAKKPNGRVDPSRYRCNHPDCFNWAYKSDLTGKRTICAVCGVTETLMDYENLKRSRPSCFKCSGSKRAKALKTKYNIFEEILGETAATVGGKIDENL